MQHYESALLNNVINSAVSVVMTPEYLLLDRMRGELAEASARSKGIQNFRGYQYMGNIYQSRKHSDTIIINDGYPALEPKFWNHGEKIKMQMQQWGRDRDRLKQWMALFLPTVSQTEVTHWISALPSAATKLMFPVYDQIKRIHDPEYWKPTKESDAKLWESMMDMIHSKIAMRLLL